MNRFKFLSIVVFALFVGVSTIAQADSIFPQIVGVTATSTAAGGEQGSVGQLVDDSGMTGDVQSRDGFSVGYRVNMCCNLTPFDITFDLGSVQPVDNMQIWNYNEFPNAGGSDQGLREFTLLHSDDDVLYTSLGLKIAAQNDSEQATPGGESSLHSEFAIGTSARYVRIGIGDGGPGVINWGNTGAFVGLGEVRFYGVPEPGTMVLLASGLLGLAACSRRKRK